MSRIKETSRSGTPSYMSPEQLIGKDVGKESDIWSFGVMLYELLSGKQLYKGQSYSDVLMQIKEKPFETISNINEKLNSLIKKCIIYNYKDRFRYFREILEYLNITGEGKTKEPKPIIIEKVDKKKIKYIEGMIFVNGGTFQMGSNDGEGDEKPVHFVTVDDFYLCKYEVSQKEWKEIMGNNPSNWKGDNLPVEKVSWYDAVEFCNKKSDKEGLTRCYICSGKNIKCNFDSNGYRLLAEAEWEYAARGGKKSKCYEYSGSNNINDVAWYSCNSSSKTHPVGTKQANELGIYDISGNVWEWCNDWHDKNYYKNSPKNNPKGPNSGSARVLRGGGWYVKAEYCRVANRGGSNPDSSYISVGFRLARSQ